MRFARIGEIPRSERISGSGTPWWIGSRAMWEERIVATRIEGLGPLVGPTLDKWFPEEFQVAEPALCAGVGHMLGRTLPEGYIGTCTALRDADYAELAARISVPTLCVAGEKDGSTPPEVVRALAGRVPGARFETIPGAGHLPSIDAPDRLAALIRGFAERFE